jgi:regulator of sigma E protease
MPDYKNEEMPAYSLGGIEPVYQPIIGAITPGSAAEKQGIKSQDMILAIDNQTIISWTQIPDLVTQYNPAFGPMQLVIMRQDAVVILSVKPEYSKEYKRYLLGIAPATEIVHYGPVEALPRALEKSWEYTTLIFSMLSKLAHHDVSPKQLAGPVGIIQMSGAAALGSIVFLLNFMALIGINLGVLNLFPLIITDGGVLFFLLIESVRRKPLPLKAQLMLNRIAIAFFITLFLFVTFNDIMRIPTLFKMMGN